jgi:hypothetical protein
MPAKIPEVKYWLDCAEDARRQAEQMVDAEAKREMMRIETAYRRLAGHVQRRSSSKKS